MSIDMMYDSSNEIIRGDVLVIGWDRKRVYDTIFDLLMRREIDVKSLVSHRFPFERAEEAFKLIDEKPNDVVKTLLTFT